jgi:microcin C transport system substrate-binding protein
VLINRIFDVKSILPKERNAEFGVFGSCQRLCNHFLEKYMLQRFTKIALFYLCLTIFSTAEHLQARDVITSHGVTLYGPLLYESGFKRFAYVNPNAPKGGTIVTDISGFDSINPYITLGTAPAFADLPFAETLMTKSADEPNSAYGLIAETITYPADHKWVEFRIRDIARWNDGKPLTADDVIYSYELIRDKSAPTFSNYVNEIEKAEKIDRNTVKFTFIKSGDRNRIYNLATELPVFARHYWEKRDFSQPTTDIPVQSTPYAIAKVDAGNSILLRRDTNYWGKDLPVNAGRHNFDLIRMDVFRDPNIAYEAFMGGSIDVRLESTPTRWKTGYKTDAVAKGLIKLKENQVRGPLWFLGIGMNGRRPQFQDAKTREALTHAFDWEWTNRNIFHGMYKRSNSYFANTELAHRGIPEGRELALLEPYRTQLDPRVFTQPFDLPNTYGTTQGLRANLKKASELLNEAGWKNAGGRLMRDGKVFTVDFMLQSPADEPIFAPFVENLKLLGIQARLSIVDATAFWSKVFNYEWDMISNGLYPHSLSPGPEVRQYWGSSAADEKMSFNTQYIKNPVVDALIEKVVEAQSREDKITACSALDRVLLWNYYSINLYFWDKDFLVYWDRFGIPAAQPKWEPFSPRDTWWIDPQKDAVIRISR